MLVDLDTGNNPTKREKILKKVMFELIRQRNCQPLMPVMDRTERRYAYKLRQRDDNITFYLVARSTKPYRGCIVSIQKSLVQRAWREGHAIIMYVNGEFIGFNPANILSANIGENKRFGVQMLNFDVKMGRKWNPPEVNG